MDTAPSFRVRGRGAGHEINGRTRQSKNKYWVAGGSRSGTSTPNHREGDRWERGGSRGGRGRGTSRPRNFPNASLVVNNHPPTFENAMSGDEEYEEEYQEGNERDERDEETEEPVLDTPEAREKFYLELVKAREIERKKAIAEGKMDDPLIPKRLEDAINLVGTCMDMAPRFERYRRERENNLYEWETIPGTKRVDHKRAVKMYERAAGDKTLPSDLRPPAVLKKTLDYLFHDLLPREGFSRTFNFVRDRSRAVRNDFTMQHETGPLAIECHDRCARFHILALHFEREQPGFSVPLEEQQLMNTLQSLKEFYEDQRGRYESPTELEMRVYHRLVHIRDQKERHEDIPLHITENPVFKLTTRFRQCVQAKSAPISKTSKLVVDEQGMEIFGELAKVLREQGSVVMIYLVACILERLFGPDTIDDIEGIRGDLSIPDIIDGVSTDLEYDEELYEPADEGFTDESQPAQSAPAQPSASKWLTSNFGPSPTPSPFAAAAAVSSVPSSSFSGTLVPSTSSQPMQSAFSNLTTTPNAFGNTSVFGISNSKTLKSAFTSMPAATSSSSAQNPLGPTTQVNASTSTSEAPLVFGITAAASPFTTKTMPSQSPDCTNGQLPVASAKPSSWPSSVSSPFAPATTSPITTNGANGSHATEMQVVHTQSSSEVSLYPSSSARSSAELPLNPAAAPFIPTFKPMSSPLRHNGTEDHSDINDATSSTSSQRSNFNESSSSIWPSVRETSKADPPQDKSTHASLFRTLPSLTNIPTSTTTPPSRPRINTSPRETNAVQPQSPLPQPPPLNKHQTISLPSTPTIPSATPSLPSPGPPKRTKSILDSLKGSLEIGVSASSEILSPLVLQSPSTSRVVHNLINPSSQPVSPLSGGRTPFDKLSSPLSRKPLTNGKGKEPDVGREIQAINFSKRSALIKHCFERWRTRLTDRLAWVEACQRSDTYSQKVQRERLSWSPAPDRKRRVAPGISLETSQRKRARKRVSSEYKKPHTDEELARRFKANHEEHERRWAEGSFLQRIRKHIRHTSTIYPHGWHIWLSMNPETDATAIWLERKFDVPSSGQWTTENIFSIPLALNEVSPIYPGVIVFECTPLESFTDEIERKYRILDDCSRLRDIIDALPARRHFIPCLLTISWPDTRRNDATSDLYNMISKLVGDHVLGSHQDFPVASDTKALDDKLEEALALLPLDIEGKLVQSLSVKGIFKSFEPAWRDLVPEWLDSCSANGDFDWYLYGRVVESSVNLLNATASTLLGLLDVSPTSALPSFSNQSFMDSDTTYDVVLLWLETGIIQDKASDISRDLRSRRNMAKEFPSDTFMDLLYDLTIRLTEWRVGAEAKNRFCVLNAELTSAHRRLEDTANALAADLRRYFALRARRSPKRRPSFDASETSRYSTPSKKRKVSLSNLSTPSDGASQPSSPPSVYHSSPSPSISMSTVLPDGESPGITVAMLRALTRDVKAKYGGSPLAKG